MQHSSAAVAFVVALMLAPNAFAQTGTAIAVLPRSIDVALAGEPPCSASFCKSIVRYQNKGLIGITEYDTAPPCKFKDSGTWTPGTDIQPTDDGKPAGTVDVSQPAFQGPPPAGCDDSGGPYLYKPIYFKWTLHKNLTAVANFGPTATFNSRWQTKDGLYDVNYSFQITVPVVRPKGETSTFVRWDGSKGKWKVTLKCCAAPIEDDPEFDFRGETIREVFLSETNGCSIETPHPPNSTVIRSGPPGSFGDSVGWDSCTVHFARCEKRTPCGFGIRQQMQIHSPADAPGTFVNYGDQPNYLSSIIEGRIISNSAGKLSFRAGYGAVTSQRTTPLSPGPDTRQQHEFVSDKLGCFANLLDFQLYLKMVDKKC